MQPYSNDLRERVISAVDHHEGTLSHIARRFQVSLKTVRRWLQRRRQTGSLDPALTVGAGTEPLMARTPNASSSWCGNGPTRLWMK